MTVTNAISIGVAGSVPVATVTDAATTAVSSTASYIAFI
jgi:hypothetical protein